MRKHKKMKNNTDKTRSKAAIPRIQLHRLARIAALLQRNAYPTVEKILREYIDLELFSGIGKSSYCEKTVLRDIAVLKEDFNCPVAYNRSAPGYYLTQHNWAFNCPADLTETAMLTLIVGAKLAEDVFPDPIRHNVKAAVDEILKGNNPDFLDTTLVKSLKVFAESGAIDVSNVFPIVFNAWQTHHSLKIKYDDLRGGVTERMIDPHVLFLYDKEWRIKAYCHLKKAPRTFVISRIASAEQMNCTFVPDMNIVDSVTRDNIVGFNRIPDVKIRLTGDARKFAIASRMHSRQTVTPNEDGVSWTYSIPEISAEVIVPWILSQGGNAVPLSPPCIVEDVRNRVKRLSAMIKQSESQQNS